MTDKIKAIVNSITVKHIIDDDADLDYLGEFSNQKGKYPVEHNGDNGYQWFNATNVENMAHANENYNRMMQFVNGYIYSIGIKAVASIHIPISIGNGSSIIQHISSSGLWGIESDSDKEYIEAIELEQVVELKDCLKVLCCGNIDSAPIEIKEMI